MKNVKKTAANFATLNASQMGKIKGGQWYEYTDSNGKVIRVWV